MTDNRTNNADDRFVPEEVDQDEKTRAMATYSGGGQGDDPSGGDAEAEVLQDEEGLADRG